MSGSHATDNLKHSNLLSKIRIFQIKDENDVFWRFYDKRKFKIKGNEILMYS